MPLTHDVITALAPDQSSLKAANGLTKASKWPLREISAADQLIWGECQGSGANPYRTVVDTGDHGYKCTCPSRKFPCKHALALMWMYVDDPQAFQQGNVPEWVNDWLGRRRTTSAATKPELSKTGKSLTAARIPVAEKTEDPQAESRRKAAAEKRAKDTRAALIAAADDLELWIADQLRTGLAGFLDDCSNRCRAIAARLVDGKAQALAGRLDELPARIIKLPTEERLETVLQELGKIVLLLRAWRSAPEDTELRRAISTSETRDSLIDNQDALKVTSRWEVVGEDISTRRDGLVSQATWLINLGNGPAFAVLLDFFPASLGKRASAFAAGEQFEAELIFYPARAPLRAVLATRQPGAENELPWPTAPEGDPLQPFLIQQDIAPWTSETPLLLPDGRLFRSGRSVWWQSSDAVHTLPVQSAPAQQFAGMELNQTAALWDGRRLRLFSARTNWGRIQLDD
ncbi:SWIM zinc finger family protein [Roseibium sp.]|uniref:SWIM zinc finger family protein n=1 Tax=Roseibium sp. TaxID=1936156 RepID=UPI003BAEF5CF